MKVDKLMAELAARRPTRSETTKLLAVLPHVVVVRQTRLDGIPHAFRGAWHHWDRIRAMICQELDVDLLSIRLTGSANQGFNYKSGAPWDPTTSDLDLFILSGKEFHSLESTIENALHDREKGDPRLQKKWREPAVEMVKRHLHKRFVSTKQVPAFLPTMQKYSRCRTRVGAYAATNNLAPGAKKVSFRVYESLRAAEKQLARSLH